MSDLGHDQTDKELKRIENLISKEYSQAAQELENKMKKHFADFDRKDAEMKKKLDAGVITQKQYQDWRVGQLAIGDRWREVRDSMVDTLVNTDKAAVSIIQGNSIKAYGDNMNYGTYEIEHSSKINTGFSLYDMDTVKNLLKEDPGIVPMPKDLNIPKDELWNRQKLSSAVLQGVLQGDSITGIADRLSQVATMDESAAIRNARTYTTAAENKGRLDSYERANNLGIQTKKKWIATLDDRTRMEHRHLDGMVVANDDVFKTDGFEIAFPGDPSAEPEMFYNCRCTLVAEIVGYDYKDERNDSKLGDMDYEDWKHAKDRETEELEKRDVLLTDAIRDYNLPKEVQDKVPEIMELKTYSDFEAYFDSYGIKLDTDIESLKGDRRDEEIENVTKFCQKVAVANETYRSEFGDDALSSLKTIVLYDNEETSKAAYYFNMVGEDDPKAGSIRFADWNADGRQVMHEFAHAMQDSMKDEGSDACLFAKEIAENVSMDNVPEPKTKYDDYSYEAEKMADALGRAYWSGNDVDTEFVDNLKNYLEEREPAAPAVEVPTIIFNRYTDDNEKAVRAMYADQVSKYSTDERNGIRRYVGDTNSTKYEYEKINGYLRNGGKISKANEEAINGIDKAIENFEVKEPFTARRGVDYDAFYSLIPGFNDNTTLEEMKDALVGSEFVDKGYMSASWNVWHGFSRDVYLEVDVPAGKGYGCMVGNLPRDTKVTEDEFILKRNTHVEFYDVTIDKYQRIILHSKIVED